MCNAYVINGATRLTIGQLARTLDVNVETVRFYERIGLIEQPERPPFGHRRYSSDVVNRVRFIQRAKSLGFSLREIKELLAMDGAPCEDVRSLAQEKRRQISDQIQDLTAIRRVLDSLIDDCRTTSQANSCSLIGALAGTEKIGTGTEKRNYII